MNFVADQIHRGSEKADSVREVPSKSSDKTRREMDGGDSQSIPSRVASSRKSPKNSIRYDDLSVPSSD